MEKFSVHTGIVGVLNRQNVDTDQIIPKQFLKFIGKTGFGKYLFFDWRFLENGELNPNFELNAENFKGASILIAGQNFGCGSSREHAPWSLLDYGFKVIISSKFADIFWNNCFKNGILPITLDEAKVQALMQSVDSQRVKFSVDLQAQQLVDNKGKTYKFEIDDRRKKFLLEGLDDIKYTMQFEDKIKQFEVHQKQVLPWLWH